MMERSRKVRTVMNLGMFEQIFDFNILILSPLFVNNVAVKSAIVCVERYKHQTPSLFLNLHAPIRLQIAKHRPTDQHQRYPDQRSHPLSAPRHHCRRRAVVKQCWRASNINLVIHTANNLTSRRPFPLLQHTPHTKPIPLSTLRSRIRPTGIINEFHPLNL
jgi:hypothetical protein